MIAYFSGTGNSRFVAKSLAEQLHTQAKKIFDSPFKPREIQGFVFPIYSWGIPPVILKYIEEMSDNLASEVWVVCTCGDETGNAPKQLQKALGKVRKKLLAFWSVQMPNNYVLLPGFGVDSPELEHEKLSKAPARIGHIAKEISAERWISDYVSGSFPALRTLVWPLFKRWGINPKYWHFTDACIGCGKCAKVCPSENIVMEETESDTKTGHPKWGENCLSCTACFHVCPKNAVQYGKITAKMGQYQHFLKKL